MLMTRTVNYTEKNYDTAVYIYVRPPKFSLNLALKSRNM